MHIMWSSAECFPSVQSGQQFAAVLGDPRHREELKKIVNAAPPVCRGSIDASLIMDTMDAACDSGDAVVYDELVQLISTYEDIAECTEQGTCFDAQTVSRRAENRARTLSRHLPKINTRGRGLLDIGCGDGSITAALGRLLKLPRGRVFGVDVHVPTDTSFITFSPATDDCSLEFPDGSMFLVTCLMSLHHIPDQTRTIAEIYRVLRPGGILLLREHDAASAGFKTVLDIMHGLYSLVWSKPAEDPDFLETYSAEYQTRAQWRKKITQHRMRLILKCSSPPQFPNSNPYRQYIDIFEKPLSS